MMRGANKELSLLLNICLDDRAKFVAGEPPAIDWVAFRELSSRHRVDGLTAAWLIEHPSAGAPVEIFDDLYASFRAQSLDYLRRARETMRLSQRLDARGIRSIVLKGVDVAETLYPASPATRQSIDIDLLVAPADFLPAQLILRDEGYIRHSPEPEMPDSARSMAMHLTNAFEFVDTQNNLKVELHHRLLRDPGKLAKPFESLLRHSLALPIGGGVARRLSRLDAAVFLCAHAAEHAYFRIKWVADIARLLRDPLTPNISEIRQHARTFHCERDVLLSLLLLSEMTEGVLPLLSSREERILTPLIEFSHNAILRDNNIASGRFTITRLLDRLRKIAFSMGLAEGPGSMRFRALLQLCNLSELSTLKLGVEWWWLYALLGRPMALLRLLRRS